MKSIKDSATRRAVFFTILVFLLMFSSIPIVKADPGWLSGWDHRKAITITGSIAGAQTDYQIRIQVEYGVGVDAGLVVYLDGECESDFGDINFTSSDEITSLDYWIQQKVDDDVAYIWVEVDSIPESPDTKTIYIYYGKTGETTSSNFKDTWIEVDDYSVNPTIGRSQVTNYVFCSWDIIDRDILNRRFDFDVYVWNHVYNSYSPVGMVGLFNRTSATPIQPFAVRHMDDTDLSQGNFYQYWTDYDTARQEDTGVAWVEDEWAVYSLKFDGTFNLDIWRKSAEVFTIQDRAEDYDVTFNAQYMGVWWYAGAGYPGTVTYDGVNDWIDARPDRTPGSVYFYIDNFRVGKYCDPEPTITAWGEEENPPVLESPSKLFGAGFNASSPYVSLYWSSNYTDEDITLFEIQNSTDKITWEYLGQNTTTEYHDFQVVNGTERYYRIRACNFTGVSWDNSTFTDIDFETVYFIEGDGDGIESVNMNPSIIMVIFLIVVGISLIYSVRRKR